jgi:hypothetical protein
VRRVTIDGPVSVGIHGRHDKRHNSDAQVAANSLKDNTVIDPAAKPFYPR